MTTPAETISGKLLALLNGLGGELLGLDYLPDALQHTPLATLILTGMESAKAGQVTARTYTFEAVVWLTYQDPQTAEAAVRSWPDTVADAIEADPTLTGTLGAPGGHVAVRMGQPLIEDDDAPVRFRGVPFTITVLRKTAA